VTEFREGIAALGSRAHAKGSLAADRLVIDREVVDPHVERDVDRLKVAPPDV
jgi:hypothetical protein